MNNVNPEGIVASAELCAPLASVRVQRVNAQGKIAEETYSDDTGRWRLSECGTKETVTFCLPGFVRKTYDIEDLSGIIRLLENRLIGYQKVLWFLPGETVEAYVHSPKQYSAALYRHGFQKKCIVDLGSYPAQIQQVQDGYFVDTALNWNLSFSYLIPNNCRPGLYSLLLRADKQEPFAIPMVVSTPIQKDGQKAKILVLANTNTWQSYNIWGGRSRYRNFENANTNDLNNYSKSYLYSVKRLVIKFFPDRIVRHLKTILKIFVKKNASIDSRQWMFKKLSLRRPFTNCRLEDASALMPFTNHLAGGEWRLLAWIEREKIPYDFMSGYELHSNTELLKGYKAIIFSTHCEYWTKQMFNALKYFHTKRGLWILNLSGNTMYREIDFFDDGSTHCVSLSFNKSCADESQILGVRYSSEDYGTCAPYRILAPNHWIFKGISISKHHRSFGGLSLNQNTPKSHSFYDAGRTGLGSGLEGMGASGWETDKLTKTAPKDIKIIAKGMNRGGGADMVIREPSGSRGGMFSASSVVFGGSLLIDNVASLILKNVFSRIFDE